MIRFRFTSHLLIIILWSATISVMAQEQPGPPQASAPSQTSNQTTPNLTTRIDQLLEQCKAHLKAGRLNELVDAAEEALRLSEQINDHERGARAAFQIGSVYYHQGKSEEAVEMWKRTARLAQEAGDPTFQLSSQNRIAGALGNLGRYDEALSFLTNSQALAEKLGDHKRGIATLMLIGWIYRKQGDYDQAESLLLTALKQAKELNDDRFLDTPLHDLGELELSRGRYPEALGYYEQRLRLEPKLDKMIVRATRVDLRIDMAGAYTLIGNFEKAEAVYKEALQLAREDKIFGSELSVLEGLGLNDYARGRYVEALDWLTKAQTGRLQGSEKPENQWVLSLALGRVQRALGHSDDALFSYKKALDAVELIRRNAIPSEPAKASVVVTRREVFTDTIDLLGTLGRNREALEVAEQYHARAFLDLLVESSVDPREDLTKEQRQREDRLLARISTVQKELWGENLPAGRVQQLTQTLSQAETDLELFQLELRRTNPRYATLRYLKPLKLERIQNELLDPETTIVEYMLGEKRSFAWVISQKNLLTISLPPRQEIETQIEAYRASLAEKVSALNVEPSFKNFQSLSRKLYDILIAPLAPSLLATKHLIIVPEGALAYLPFETLLSESKGPSRTAAPVYLLEQFSISYVPSASAWAAIKTRNHERSVTAKSFIAYGDPTYQPDDSVTRERSAAHPAATSVIRKFYAARGLDFQPLPYTRKEVAAIGSLFPAAQRRIYVGSEAREQKVKKEQLDRFSFIHFAAHGWVDEQKPMRSGIVLSLDGDPSEDGVLQVGEIIRLKLNADLVTLSACRTGLGKLLNGEGVLGLTRAFFYAGARSVTVSLWNVNDLATAELMNSFYRNLRRGMAKDEALRQAKLVMIKSPNRTHQHPYFWAPFVLIGEPK